MDNPAVKDLQGPFKRKRSLDQLKGKSESEAKKLKLEIRNMRQAERRLQKRVEKSNLKGGYESSSSESSGAEIASDYIQYDLQEAVIGEQDSDDEQPHAVHLPAPEQELLPGPAGDQDSDDEQPHLHLPAPEQGLLPEPPDDPESDDDQPDPNPAGRRPLIDDLKMIFAHSGHSVPRDRRKNIMDLIRYQFHPPGLPKSDKTLWKNRWNIIKGVLDDGAKISNYPTYDLTIAMLREYERKFQVEVPNPLIFKLNTDGVDVYHNSIKKFHVVYLGTDNLLENVNIPISILIRETGKPLQDGQYLEAAVNLMNRLNRDGIFDRRVTFKLFCCDAIAHCENMGIVYPSGLQGCPWCRTAARKTNNVVNWAEFPDLLEPRTNRATRNNEELNFRQRTPMFRIYDDFDLVKRCPPDRMHQIDIGIVKTLMKYLFRGRGPFLGLSQEMQETVLAMIQETGIFIPRKLTARRPRHQVTALSKWKAAEGRVFVTFQMCMLAKVFQAARKPQLYKLCILLFHISRCLETPSILQDPAKVNDVYFYCVDFLRTVALVFGPEAVVFNFHSLLHFPEAAALLGPATSWSCYTFENTNMFLGVNLRQFLHELQEISNRYTEYAECSFFKFSPFVKAKEPYSPDHYFNPENSIVYEVVGELQGQDEEVQVRSYSRFEAVYNLPANNNNAHPDSSLDLHVGKCPTGPGFRGLIQMVPKAALRFPVLRIEFRGDHYFLPISHLYNPDQDYADGDVDDDND